MTYPANLASDVVLRDGSTVSLRPVQEDDGPLLLEFFGSLAERSLAFRFFTGAPNLKTVAQMLAKVDQRTRFGLLAMRGQEHRPVGHGFYAAIDAGRAEVAFAVADELQGHGLGSILLAQLAERAAESGFSTFVADIMPENHTMVAMFRDSGFPVDVRSEPDAVAVELPTSPDPGAIARFQERDTIAARAAVAAVLDGDAVAAIEGGPRAIFDQAQGCAATGVRAVVVRSPLSEDGTEKLLRICRGDGTRLVGPASFGVLDNRRPHPVNLTPMEEPPPPGPVGIVAQGADSGRELLAEAVRRGVGVSTFVSLGARADITANDMLEYWEEDPATAVAVLQVESFSDPRRFARVARRVGARKPIIVIAERVAAEPPGEGLFAQVGATPAAGAVEALQLAAALVSRRVDDVRDARPARLVVPAARSDEAAAILAAALAGESPELSQGDCTELLDCYGVKVGLTAGSDAAFRLAVDADPWFGPVLRLGPAGCPLPERPARVCPLDEDDAGALLRDLSAAGAAAVPTRARAPLERTLEAIAGAATAHAEIAALEIDPLLAAADGCVAGRVRVEVRRPPERRPWPRTWD